LSRARLPAGRRQLEAFEPEARYDRAADERPGAERPGGLPPAVGHDDLRSLAVPEVRAEDPCLDLSICRSSEAQLERIARVEMPRLGRVDPMPVGQLAGPEQVIDGR
jgi:hypothetical protein